MPAAVCAALLQGTLEKLPFAVVANVAPIMPDVLPIMTNITAIGPKVSLVLVDVAPLVACSPIISVSHVFA
jgi:hypothetical protein